ncbi:hypothetical protein TcYC6_0026740 [Trypanosoma cruzi]|nr:hypothetical protein TcYC6_0026740 [Trypanosoma cruzi]
MYPNTVDARVAHGKPQLSLELPQPLALLPVQKDRIGASARTHLLLAGPRHHHLQLHAEPREPPLEEEANRNEHDGPQQARQQLWQRRGVEPDTSPAVQVHLQGNRVRHQPPQLLPCEGQVAGVPVHRGVAGVVVVRHEAVLPGAVKGHRVHVCGEFYGAISETQRPHDFYSVVPSIVSHRVFLFALSSLLQLPQGPAPQHTCAE